MADDTGPPTSEPKIEQKGPRRAWRYWVDVIWAGTVGLFKAIETLWGIGLIAFIAAIVSGSVYLLANYNVGWFLAAGFALFLAISVVGGYRVWSQTERAYVQAKAKLDARGEPKVSTGHKSELQEIANGLLKSIANCRRARYQPPALGFIDLRDWPESNASSASKRSFRTHFPEVAPLLDAWDVLVAEIDTARDRFRNRILTEAAAQGIAFEYDFPTFLADAVERGFYVWGSAVELADAAHLVSEWEEYGDYLGLGGMRLVKVSPGDDREALKEPYDDLLRAATESEEGLALVGLRERRTNMREELEEHLQQIRALHVIRGRCLLCS